MSRYPEICEYLDWDSGFFGMRIGRLRHNRLNRLTVAAALEWCNSNGIDCLYFLAEASDRQTVCLAEGYGFQLVDIRMTFSCALESGSRHPTESYPCTVRHFQSKDADVLRAIARRCHHDSRFYFDGHFEASRCDSLYEKWIERSWLGWAQAVFVAHMPTPIGYVSCHLSEQKTGSIGLIAVVPECQGRGAGRALVGTALQFFRESGMHSASVVTQGRNYGSQRLYQRCGFRTESVHLWYHRWFRSPSGVVERQGRVSGEQP